MSKKKNDKQYQLPRGVQANLETLNPSGQFVLSVIYNFIKDVLQEEAQVHNADFSQTGFKNVQEAIANNQLHVSILETAYENDSLDYVGAILYQPSLRTTWNKDLQLFEKTHALWVEDTFVRKEASRELKRKTGQNGQRTGISLGEFLNHEIFRQSVSSHFSGKYLSKIAGYYLAECGENNAPMHRIYDSLHPNTRHQNLYVMQLTEEPALASTTSHSFSILHPSYIRQDGSGLIPNHAFTIEWWANEMDKHRGAAPQFHMDVVRNISTYTGDPVFRAFITHGDLQVSQGILRSAYAVAIRAAADKICEKGWNQGQTRDEVIRHIYFHPNDANASLAIRGMNTIVEIAGIKRKLGSCYMQPVVVDYTKMPQAIFGNEKRRSPDELLEVDIRPPFRGYPSGKAEGLTSGACCILGGKLAGAHP